MRERFNFSKDNESVEEKNGESDLKSLDEDASENEAEVFDAGSDVLEEGKSLDISELSEKPLVLGSPMRAPGSVREVSVSNFTELENAINNATVPTKIIITSSFDITRTLVIKDGQDITLTSAADRSNIKAIGQDKISQPEKDDDMQKRQNLVKEAEAKGEKALADTDLSKNPLPKVDYVLKRAEGFKETLIRIVSGGKLTIGTDNKDPIFIDGNKGVKTNLKASFIDVNGELVMNGGFIANGDNEKAYSAPIYVCQGGHFTMNGGRITSNKNIYQNSSYFEESGAVFINKGGTFILNHGSIDNNEAAVGGVYLGISDLQGTKFAQFTMNGGIIANNLGPLSKNANADVQYYGGAVHVDSCGNFEFNNGILAGNSSYHGGGVAINDNYINGFNFQESNTNSDSYEDYVKYAGAYYTQNGGLIYKNTAKLKDNNILTGAGGGLYINSSTTSFNGGYILNNKSEHEGGGIYVSSFPQKLTLQHTLITKNRAVNNNKTLNQLSPGEGGGYWNCPVGDVDIQDYHSLYIFENEALYNGADIHTGYKASKFKINGVDKKFTTRISPLTEKGNIINYKDDLRKGIPEYMYHTNEATNLKAQYDAETIKEAWTNSNLFIIGNESDRGGGVGSNADIFSPGNPKNNKVIIEKRWDKSIPEDKIPESIWVDLYIGNAKYAEVELSKKNNWIYMFENLPFTSEELAKKGLKYKLKERSDDFYSVIEESDKSFLEVERIWANYNNTYDPKPSDINHSEKIIFVYKDKNGKEIKRENVKISNFEKDGKRWTGLLNNDLFAGLKNLDNVTIKYHGFDKPYIWQGYYGLDGKSDWDGSGPWHEAYVIEKADGTIEVQLPYIWAQYMKNPNWNKTNNYSKNKAGYRLALVTNHAFTITNYPYSEIPIEKHWDKSIKKEDIPDSINVYLLKDGKRFVDENGKDRLVTLSKANGWKGKFEKLPYLGLPGMSFDHYWVKEDSEIFIPLVKVKEKPMLDVFVERIQELANGYKIDDDDYPGGVYRVEYIPFEVHHGNKVYKFNVTFHSASPYIKIRGDLTGEKTFLADIELPENKNIEIRTYYDEDGNPFPRKLGKYEGYWGKEPGVHINPGAYVLKLVEEDGKLVLYVPKLTPSDMDENLLKVNANIIGSNPYFELTNYYLPKHRIEIEKIWDVRDASNIPGNLKVKIKGKYVTKEITLSPENWKYFEEFLGKGLLATNNYEFSEEDLEKFDGSQAIERSMEFEVENKTLSFLDPDGNSLTKDEFNEFIKGKKYSFELVDAQDEKAEITTKFDENGNLVIVYPVDVTITEVAHIIFTNTEKPEKPPENPPGNPPEEPKTPPEEPKTPPEEIEVPKEEVEIPKITHTPDHISPKTYDPGIGIYLALSGLSFLGLCEIKKKKKFF